MAKKREISLIFCDLCVFYRVVISIESQFLGRINAAPYRKLAKPEKNYENLEWKKKQKSFLLGYVCSIGLCVSMQVGYSYKINFQH